MDWKYLYTSFEGRINRQPYWIGALVLIGALIVINLVLILLAGFAGLIIVYIISLLVIYPSLAMMVKRFHDRNKSGWWSLIFYVPAFINGAISAMSPESSLTMITGVITLIVLIWFTIELGFLKGTDGPNDFGPDPLQGQG